MIKRMCSKVLPVVLALGLLCGGTAWAGKEDGHGHCHKKVGFFQRLGRAIRHLGDHIKNGIMDFGVKVKYFFTGRKCRVWVCGYYDHNGRHVKGHWRYLNNCHGKPGQGNPGQGNTPGQGSNPGQGGGSLPPLPPENPPAESPAQPPSDLPPTGEPPASDQGQGDQGQGDQGQGNPGQGKRTLGMLMNDLVSASADLDQLKRQAVQARKGKAKPEVMMSMAEDYTLIANDREADGKRLVRVITQDLEQNQGRPGIYYSAYLRNLSRMTKADRDSIRDILESIEKFVKAEALEEGKNSPYHARLAELSKF